MCPIKTIFFDCMETIIELYELPTRSDYAYWAFSNSGVEHYWVDFGEFLRSYDKSLIYISSIKSMNEEYEMIQRMEYVVNHNRNICNELKQEVIRQLYNTYWSTYKSKCFVHQEVKEVLKKLSNTYKLVVVSNFKVRNGIEELLAINGIDHLFEFVVTSIHFGWRKPDPRIYQYAIKQSNCRPEEIVFVGDDYENDAYVPTQLGIKSFLLNKGRHYCDAEMIADFKELEIKLEMIR